MINTIIKTNDINNMISAYNVYQFDSTDTKLVSPINSLQYHNMKEISKDYMKGIRKYIREYTKKVMPSESQIVVKEAQSVNFNVNITNSEVSLSLLLLGITNITYRHTNVERLFFQYPSEYDYWAIRDRIRSELDHIIDAIANNVETFTIPDICSAGRIQIKCQYNMSGKEIGFIERTLDTIAYLHKDYKNLVRKQKELFKNVGEDLWKFFR